jgi:hypothetical protein
MLKNLRVCVLFLVCGSVCAQAPWSESVEDIKRVSEFLSAQADASNDRRPPRMRFEMQLESKILDMHWEGVIQGGKLRAEYSLDRLDGPDSTVGEDGLGLVRWLRFSGSEWIEVTPDSSGDRSKPWNAIVSAKCPSAFWKMTILPKAKEPLAGRSVGDAFGEFVPIAVREQPEEIEVDFVMLEGVAAAIREERFDDVGGFVGMRVKFARAAAWRPVDIKDVYRLPGMEGGELAKLEVVDMQGLKGYVWRRVKWADFFDVEGVSMPGSCHIEGWVEQDATGQVVPAPYVEMHRLTASGVAESLESAEFAAVPPPQAGPVGRISNLTTGERTIIDGRGAQEKVSAQDSFVRRAIDETGKSHGGIELSGVEWAAYSLLFLGAVGLGWGAFNRKRK